MLDPVSVAAIAAPYLAKGAEALAETAREKIGKIVGNQISLCSLPLAALLTAVTLLASTPNTNHEQYSKEPQNEKNCDVSTILLSDKATSVDFLGYEIFTDPIAKLISQLNADNTPLTIGIFGEWGSGKTSFLKMVCRSLKNNYDIESIVFNAWKYEKEENLWSALLQCILNHFELKGTWRERAKIKFKLWLMTFNLKAGLSEIARRSLITISKFIISICLVAIIIVILQPNISAYLAERNLTAGEITLIGGGGFSIVLLSLFTTLVFLKAENLLNLLDKNLNIDFSKFSMNLSYKDHISLLDRIDQEFRNIIKLVRNNKEPEKPVVIIIDDLDRCLPEKALQVIEGIKLFLDMEYCVYLFALDRNIIEKIVHVKYKDMNLTEVELKKLRENYIDKLIQLSIPIPLVDEDRIKEYVKILYSKYDKVYGDYISDIFAQALPHNPRKIKHTIQRYLVWREIADTMINENAICPILLAKIVVIQDQFKEIFNEIIENNLLLRALESSSLGEDQEEGDEKRSDNISEMAKAKGYLEKYPQLREILSKVDKGNRFDKCDISSYIFLLRKLPTISETIIDITPRASAKLGLPLQKPLRYMHFVDRENELASLMRDLQPGRIVTICGPGGIGKTALAAEAIWRLSLGDEPPESFPDGVIFHTFNHQPQASIALESIARAYGEDPRPSPRDAALRALMGRRALIVLDGAEACDDLETVLSVTGGCGVLITTRLHSDAPEEFIDLSLLPEDKAIKLLQAWGGSMAEDEKTCRSICTLLGRLPLAIFLAGRYMAHRKANAHDYLAWLEKTPLEALDLGTRQHESIPLQMEYNLEGISDQARTCFGIAGILAMKPFESNVMVAALQISSLQANISLGELVDCGLLTRQDVRYQITHALAHTYARERLVVPRDALARLARCYDDFSREQVKLGLTGYARLDDHRDHILAVQSACNKAGMGKEVRSLARALEDYLDLQGHWQERISLVQAGLQAARSDGARYDEGSFLNILGLAYAALGEIHKAIEHYNQALAIARELRDRADEGNRLGNLGLAHAALGEPRKAIEFYEQALAISRKIGDLRGEGNRLGSLGLAYSDLGEPRKAIEFYEQALAIAKEIGDRRGEGNRLGNLGLAYSDLGEPRKAIEFYEQALAIAKEIGDRRGEGNRLGNLGLAYSDLGEPRKAVEFYEQALAIARDIADKQNESEILCNLGKAYLDLNEVDKTIDNCINSLDLARSMEYRKFEGEALCTLGKAFVAQGELQKALDHCDEALRIFKGIEYPKGEAEALFARSQALHQLGQTKEAISCAQQALATFQRIESPLAEKVRQQLEQWQG